MLHSSYGFQGVNFAMVPTPRVTILGTATLSSGTRFESSQVWPENLHAISKLCRSRRSLLANLRPSVCFSSVCAY